MLGNTPILRSHMPTKSALPRLPPLCLHLLYYLAAKHQRRREEHAEVRFTVPPLRHFGARWNTRNTRNQFHIRFVFRLWFFEHSIFDTKLPRFGLLSGLFFPLPEPWIQPLLTASVFRAL